MYLQGCTENKIRRVKKTRVYQKFPYAYFYVTFLKQFSVALAETGQAKARSEKGTGAHYERNKSTFVTFYLFLWHICKISQYT